jgi:hypothetical protein
MFEKDKTKQNKNRGSKDKIMAFYNRAKSTKKYAWFTKTKDTWQKLGYFEAWLTKSSVDRPSLYLVAKSNSIWFRFDRFDSINRDAWQQINKPDKKEPDQPRPVPSRPSIVAPTWNSINKALSNIQNLLKISLSLLETLRGVWEAWGWGNSFNSLKSLLGEFDTILSIPKKSTESISSTPKSNTSLWGFRQIHDVYHSHQQDFMCYSKDLTRPNNPLGHMMKNLP